VIRHTVLFRWNPAVPAATLAAVGAGLGALPAAIPSIRSYSFGTDVGINEGNFDYAVVADFDDLDGYLAYRDHPDHRAVIAEHIAPNVAERVAVQFDSGT
jgi:hypothetical protein